MSSIPMLDGPPDYFPSTYIFACPETQQFHRLGGYDCDFAALFAKRAGKTDMWFWNTFAKRIDGTKRLQRHGLVAKPNIMSLLEQLPNELLDLVVDAIVKDRPSVLALGLASPILYPKVLSHIHRDYAHGRITSWVGKDVGFYGRESPITPAQIPTFEREWFTYDMINVEPWWTGYASVNIDPEHEWRKSLADACSRWKKIDKISWRNIDRDLSQAYMFPQDRVWVLRNLTTRQYVRSDGLTPPARICEDELLPASQRRTHMLKWSRKTYGGSKPVKIPARDRALDPLNLPQVFLVLTAHSAHPDWRQEDLGFRRGPWTSHAFEVIPLYEHLKCAGLVWKNVTAEVAADVGHLRWCVMQHEALSVPNVDGLWERLKEFRLRAREARAKWTQWAQEEKVEIETDTQ